MCTVRLERWTAVTPRLCNNDDRKKRSKLLCSGVSELSSRAGWEILFWKIHQYRHSKWKKITLANVCWFEPLVDPFATAFRRFYYIFVQVCLSFYGCLSRLHPFSPSDWERSYRSFSYRVPYLSPEACLHGIAIGYSLVLTPLPVLTSIWANVILLSD